METLKCGDIMVQHNDKEHFLFMFTCVFCDEEQFTKVEDFFNHFKEHHTNSYIITEENPFHSESLLMTKFEQQDDSLNDEEFCENTVFNSSEDENESIEEQYLNSLQEITVITYEPIEGVTKNKSGEQNQKFHCNKCNRKYSTKSSLQKHLRKMHNLSTHSIYNKKNNLDKDYKKNTSIISIKEINFSEEEEFEKSIYSPVNENETFEEQNLENINNRTDNRNFFEKSSTSAIVPIEEVKKNENEKKFHCHICNRKYCIKYSLKRHLKQAHSSTPQSQAIKIKNRPCQYCGKLFRRNTEREIHERIHTGEKPFQCSICGACFIANSKLGVHLLRHSNTRRYKCDQCDKNFFSRSHLNEHNIVHTGERPFKCDKCNATFPRKKALQSHSKIHSDKAAYKCTICGKTFKQSPGLYCHMKSHGFALKSC